MYLFSKHKKFLILISALIVLFILYILIPALYSGAAPFHMFNLTPKYKHITEITAIEVAHWEDTIYIDDPDTVTELVEKLNHAWYQFWIPTPIRGGTDYMLKIYRDTQYTSYGFGSSRLTAGGIWYFVDMTFLTDLFPSYSIQDGTLYYGGDPVPSDVAELDLSNTFFADYSFLQDFSDLTMLDLSYSTVTDLSPLAGCIEMKELNITNTNISDLSVLSKMPHLKKLMASETLVTDISSLSGCPGLQSLDLRWTQVTDISVLSVCSSLDGLLLKDCTGITDFSVLRNLTTLTQLDVGGTAFSQFSLLEGMPQLGDLCIASTLHPTAIDYRELLTLQLPVLYRLYVNADDETYAQLTAYFPDCEIFNSSMPEK